MLSGLRRVLTPRDTDDFVDERPQVASKRVRQHVNPLAQQYREPIEIPDWSACFDQPNLPIHLDIGCARGRYLNSVAARAQGKMNFVGVEIRKSVLDEATEEAQQRKLRNIAFVHANMNFQQQLLIRSFPARIQSVSIFHPDPWMKKRHIKRRLVTDEFVRELAGLLDHDTPIYVQTDVQELFEYMIEIFNGSGLFRMEPLNANPFVVPTDREKFVTNQGGDIFRVTMPSVRRFQHTASVLSATAFADGACRGNPGLGGCGALLIDDATQKVLASRTRFLGSQETNNTSEYHGLLLALELAEEQQVARLQVCMDSELVIKQMKGLYRVKARHLQLLHTSCTQRCKAFESVDFVHVPRSENSFADRLANQAIDSHHSTDE
ncbi:hypothetical protein P43SY_007973 [Pythium insidiosum]|uniref:tRNA (guanine(46)-N(7))-methyltransferase n=1 Tax=Pythium insidiosum TaxID=114742 RepID=A0AAD5Q9R3_PYTIN|nr:hypothetical protein P43SY_007973 [Pythium insidiosum]